MSHEPPRTADPPLMWACLAAAQAVAREHGVAWQAFEGRRRPQAMERAAAGLALWRDRRP